MRHRFDRALDLIVSRQLEDFNSENRESMDELVAALPPFWPTSHSPIILPNGLLNYLIHRRSDVAVSHLLQSMSGGMDDAWEAFAYAITDRSSKLDQKTVLMALWRVASAGYVPNPEILQRILQAFLQTELPWIAASIRPVLILHYLNHSSWKSGPTHFTVKFTDSLLPSETAVERPPSGNGDVGNQPQDDIDNELQWKQAIEHRVAEAKIALLAEFLRSCTSDQQFAYEAVKTLRQLNGSVISPVVVHETHQKRLANAIRDLFASWRCAELRTLVINGPMFEPYARRSWDWGAPDLGTPWLDNEIARRIVK
jgi:hypothetical protein